MGTSKTRKRWKNRARSLSHGGPIPYPVHAVTSHPPPHFPEEAALPAYALSERRAESLLNDLLSAQGWSLAPPPRGNVLLQHEYREHAHLRRILGKASKAGNSFGVPEAILLGTGLEPLAVIEAKASRHVGRES